MSFPINIISSGSTLLVTGATGSRMEVLVPLSASVLVAAAGRVTGDLDVQGTLTALEIKTTLVSASITYRSGSTKQGDTADDVHDITGSLRVTGGITGSLHLAAPGLSYLVGEGTVAVTSASNGQVTLRGTGVAASPWTDGLGRARTTGSVSIDSAGMYADEAGPGTWFFVSGTVGIPSASAAARLAVFGGDVLVSGSLTVGTSSVTISSSGVRFSASSSIELGPTGLLFSDSAGGPYTLRELAAGAGVADHVTGSGAASVSTAVTLLRATGAGDAVTLGSGSWAGQAKTVVADAGHGPNTSALSPTSPLGFTTITFSVVGQTAVLVWTGARWTVASLGLGASAA